MTQDSTTKSRRPLAAAFIGLVLVVVTAGWLIGRAPRLVNREDGPLAHQPTDSGRESRLDEAPSQSQSVGVTPEKSPFHFELMTPQTGIDFVYYGSPTPLARMTEQNGGGVALLDFDNDGQLDLFFVNGSSFDQPKTDLSASNRLYRARGDFQYEDATMSASLVAHGFGMGCTAGDYDNDGFNDLFVAYYGRDRLWRNNGDGTFTEVTDAAGVGCERWGTSAAFADLDGDGDLDLYVVNYVDWSPDEPPCHPHGHPEINSVCSPIERSGQADVLYQNDGSGHFDDVGEQAGIGLKQDGKGLALAIADFDTDGRLDIYVANDTSPNFLFRNLGHMRFEEVGVQLGVAVSSNGTLGASMGIGCADYDQNGYLDLCVTNFQNQVNDLFANLGSAGFAATNTAVGVDLVSRSKLGFGIVLADFNLDGWPDMFVANGHIWDLTSVGPEYEYAMTPQLLWNHQGKRFTDVSAQSGDYFHQRWLGRAVASGDLDNDGDTDLVVSHVGTPPAVLRNDCQRSGESLRINFIGTRSARQPLGCQVATVSGTLRQVTQVPSGGSFQASHDTGLLVTPCPLPSIEKVEIRWSGGTTESWVDPLANSLNSIRLIEGTGEK